MVNSNNFVTTFEEGKTYVFSLERLVAEYTKNGDYFQETNKNHSWATFIEGERVEPVNGYMGTCEKDGCYFNIHCSWCIELTPQQEIEFGVLRGQEDL